MGFFGVYLIGVLRQKDWEEASHEEEDRVENTFGWFEAMKEMLF